MLAASRLVAVSVESHDARLRRRTEGPPADAAGGVRGGAEGRRGRPGNRGTGVVRASKNAECRGAVHSALDVATA